ncbi:MAG: 50S ribosomal protein L4 [Firmicutes bacterium]|nr:50S ribosomal protein L4 [Bacillota bacterium]
MPTVDVYNMQGETVGQMELADSVFDIQVNEHVMHLAVVRHLAALRRGTHSTKTRSEVRGGGRKPWRQKGTGRARAGSRVSPIWRGGGITFGPRPRSYQLNMPKKVRRLALRSALSTKAQNGELLVLDKLAVDTPKTKTMVAMLKALGVEKALIVTDKVDENVFLSARNIPGVTVLDTNSANVYEVLKHKSLILTKDAVAKFEEVLA